MHLGIDFGTTNTVAAIVEHAGAAPRVLRLDGDARTLRTMLYVERDQTMHYGAAAVRRYRELNVGRLPRYIRQYIGEIDIELGELLAKGYDLKGGAVVLDVYSDVDADSPGRLMHALKGPLATDYEGTHVFGTHYTLEDLIASFLREVRRRVCEQTGVDVRSAVLGRPVNFAHAASAADNQRAQDRLMAAARAAGFEHVTFEYEPVGASLAYAAHDGGRDERVLVFDFGGGTLDLAVVERSAAGAHRILATGGLGIGGDRFDRALFQATLLSWFGRDVRWGAQRLAMPAHLLDALGDWQDIATLSNAPTIQFLREAQRDCDDPIRLLALEELIMKGYGYDLYERVERGKVELSRARVAEIGYAAGAIDVWQMATRAQFEEVIAPDRRAVGALIDDVLARAGVRAAQIDHVVRTGGSSMIPSFVRLLEDRFGAEKLHSEDMFTAVAAGLAVRSSQAPTARRSTSLESP